MYTRSTDWYSNGCRPLKHSMFWQGTYLTLNVLVGQESECLKVIKMLFSWYLRDWLICPMCHAFPFPSTFFSAPLPSSLSPYIWFSLPSPLAAFLCLYLSSTTLSPTPIYSLIGIPNSLFLSQTILASCLSLCLAAFLAATSSTLPLTSSSHFLSLPVSTPHNYHPTFHGKVCLLFPSFEAFSRLFQ